MGQAQHNVISGKCPPQRVQGYDKPKVIDIIQIRKLLLCYEM